VIFVRVNFILQKFDCLLLKLLPLLDLLSFLAKAKLTVDFVCFLIGLIYPVYHCQFFLLLSEIIGQSQLHFLISFHPLHLVLMMLHQIELLDSLILVNLAESETLRVTHGGARPHTCPHFGFGAGHL